MASVTLTPPAKEILIREIQRFYENFGSMNKNDFEVLLFHVLMENGCKEMNNFELSRMLRIPETKVKRFRYETDLKYTEVSDHEYQEVKMQQLNELLTNVAIKNDGKYIEFVVEDVALRRFLDNILKKEHRFSDSSFNSEIVKINIEDLEILLRHSIKNEELRTQLLSEAEKLVKERVDFLELISNMIRLAANTSSVMTDVSLRGLINLFPKIAKSLANTLKHK